MLYNIEKNYLFLIKFSTQKMLFPSTMLLNRNPLQQKLYLQVGF